VYVWGRNNYGQLGIGYYENSDIGTSESKNVPVRMYGIDDAVDVVIGDKNIAIVRRDGTIYMTGSNDNGQLGNGEQWSVYNRSIPLPVLDTDGSAIKGIVNAASGPNHTIINSYLYDSSTTRTTNTDKTVEANTPSGFTTTTTTSTTTYTGRYGTDGTTTTESTVDTTVTKSIIETTVETSIVVTTHSYVTDISAGTTTITTTTTVTDPSGVTTSSTDTPTVIPYDSSNHSTHEEKESETTIVTTVTTYDGASADPSTPVIVPTTVTRQTIATDEAGTSYSCVLETTTSSVTTINGVTSDTSTTKTEDATLARLSEVGRTNSYSNTTTTTTISYNDSDNITTIVNTVTEQTPYNGEVSGNSSSSEVKDIHTFNNEVYAWGNNTYGVLGNGIAADGNTFIDEDGNTVTSGKDLVGNDAKSVLLFPTYKSEARVMSWETGTAFDINGTAYTVYNPVPMTGIYSVFAGDHFSGAVTAGEVLPSGITEGSEVYIWGSNVYAGEETAVLGNKIKNKNQYKASFVSKDDSSSDNLDSIIQIPAVINGDHVASISRSGVIYLWGQNTRSQLGDKTQEVAVVPVVAGNAKMSIIPPTATIAVGKRRDITITGADMFAVYYDLRNSIGTFTWKVLDDTIAKVTYEDEQPKVAHVTGVTEGETRVVATNTVTHQPVFSRIIITDDITYPQLQFGKDFS
ncbi:MAG: hypothetical protein IJI48_00620, partial [Ruminococcus sp.]|nr:hypothetical protein [Ruminococcus sp.]